MAEMKDAHHIVEIPVDEEHQQKLSSAMNIISAIQHHPLMEISESPGHLLLLKLWRREEDLFGRRIARRETRMDLIRREIFQLCCFFLIFHAFFVTILFTSSVNSQEGTCRKWWIPSILSVSTSTVFVFLVQVNLWRYWKVWGQLQREKSENRALVRCIQELRMKGASFDLSKEPQSGKRMKSSSVEIKWKPITWCSQNLITICLVCFAGLFGVSCLQIDALRRLLSLGSFLVRVLIFLKVFPAQVFAAACELEEFLVHDISEGCELERYCNSEEQLQQLRILQQGISFHSVRDIHDFKSLQGGVGDEASLVRSLSRLIPTTNNTLPFGEFEMKEKRKSILSTNFSQITGTLLSCLLVPVRSRGGHCL